MTTLKEAILCLYTDESCCLSAEKKHRMGGKDALFSRDCPVEVVDAVLQLYIDDLQKRYPDDETAAILMIESAEIIQLASETIKWELLKEYNRHGNQAYVEVIAEVAVCESDECEVRKSILLYVSGGRRSKTLETIVIRGLESRGDEILLQNTRKSFEALD